MKTFAVDIDVYQAKWMFAPIRDKRSALKTLLRTVKIMLAPTQVDPAIQGGRVILAVSKFSRLVFQSKGKIFSLSFPFQTTQSGGFVKFYSASHPNIDSRCTSELIGLIERSELFESADVLDFADPICAACDIDIDIWKLFRELVLLEDGYVRYDDDEGNVNGHRHPQYHLDLFYSQGTTFKAGLKCAIDEIGLLDILNTETDCHYLQPI